MEQQPQQTRRRQCAVVLFFASALVATTSDMTAEAWRPSSRVASFGPRHHQQQRRCRHASTLSQLYSSEEDIADEDRTSFDDAGRALKEEADQEAMESMGDFDENPSVGTCIGRVIFFFCHLLALSSSSFLLILLLLLILLYTILK